MFFKFSTIYAVYACVVIRINCRGNIFDNSKKKITIIDFSNNLI